MPPGSVQAILNAYQPPLLALGAGLALGLVGRLMRRPWLVGAGASTAAVVGWAALLPVAAVFQAILAPRTMVEFLLAPGIAAVLAGLLAPWLQGRGTAGRSERWVMLALAVLTGWWLAGSAPARPEFWRVWLIVSGAAWLLGRQAAGPGGLTGSRVLAAALSLGSGLLAAAAGPVWIAASLVAVAAASGALAMGGALPPVLVVAVAAAADLATGRLVRGGLAAADVACVLALGAMWLKPLIEARLSHRLGRTRPVLAVAATAALVAGATWVSGRMLQR